MKNNRGVTLTSLAIYIIGLVTMIGLLSVFMRFFYRNVNRKSYTDDTAERYSKFIMYLTNDVNLNDIKKVYVDNSERIHIKFNKVPSKRSIISLLNKDYILQNYHILSNFVEMQKKRRNLSFKFIYIFF